MNPNSLILKVPKNKSVNEKSPKKYNKLELSYLTFWKFDTNS